MNEETSLHALACQLAEAKRVEARAKTARVDLEEKIVALVETADDGSKTVDTGDGIKITVKRSLSYSADVDALRSFEGIPDEVRPLKLVPAIAASYAFDKKAWANVLVNHPDVAAKLAKFVTANPGKPSVTLKLA